MKQLISDLKNLIFRFQDDDVTGVGAQLAYSLLLAFFPFLIFLITLIGYSSMKSDSVLLSLQGVLPSEAFVLIKHTVVEVIDKKYGNLLSISLIFTIVAASNGFKAVIKGLNKAYDEQEERGFFKLQLISILCTFALAFIPATALPFAMASPFAMAQPFPFAIAIPFFRMSSCIPLDSYRYFF